MKTCGERGKFGRIPPMPPRTMKKRKRDSDSESDSEYYERMLENRVEVQQNNLCDLLMYLKSTGRNQK